MNFKISNLVQKFPKAANARARLTGSWRNSKKLKLLMVTGDSRIERSQIYPFYFYVRDIEQVLETDIREVRISSLQCAQPSIPGQADIILFQPWFSIGTEEIVRLAKLLRNLNPRARIVFLDSAAPVDLRFAEAVEPLIDLYIKKHVFRDRSNYGKETQGDSSLVDYYEKLYDLPASPTVKFKVSETFLSKLAIGPSFFTSQQMLPMLSKYTRPNSIKKKLRVHARLGSKGSPWYQAMRKQALASCEPFKSASVVSSNSVNYRSYIGELSRSKTCFSPFGYGEVCWRDYEAIVLGSLLIKPDMSHVETSPNAFIPYQTYIPVKWDFSDLNEKLEYYLTHDSELNEIVQNAYNLLHEYCIKGGFINQISQMFAK